jgi:integrase
MPTIKLTQAAVERIKPPASGRVEYFDSTLPGFALRVADSGHKSWVAFYRVGGKLRRYTIGSLATYPKVEDARARAGEAFQKADRGIDLAEENKAAKIAAAAEAAPQLDTFRAVADLYLARHAKKNTKASSYKETKRILDRDVTPVWGDRQIASITRRDVNELLDAIIDRGAAVQANRTLARLRTLFNWAVDREIITATPIARMKLPTREKTRERVLSDDEIRAFWRGCDGLGQPFGPLFKLLLLTAQRRDEVGTVEWSEIDFERKLWTIPREKAKNDQAHEVALSEPALAILEELKKTSISTGYVFTTNIDRPVSGFSKAKARLDAAMERTARKAGGIAEGEEAPPLVPEWILHDLRRTAATGMANLNIPPHVVDKILNHVSGTIRGVAAVYNRASYKDERRAALDAWGRFVMHLLEPVGSNVVTLRGQA